MRDDADYRAVVFNALRAVTVDYQGFVSSVDLLAAVNRWAARNGVGPVPLGPFSRLVRSAGYEHFRTKSRRQYFAGLAIKEDGA